MEPGTALLGYPVSRGVFTGPLVGSMIWWYADTVGIKSALGEYNEFMFATDVKAAP